jgi:signal transduction histidine kinase
MVFITGSSANFILQLRAKEENQRSRDMNAALAAFVEGKSKSSDWWHCNARSHNYETADNSTAGPRGSRIRTPSERIPLASQSADSHPERSLDSAPGGYFAEHQPPPNPHIPRDNRSSSEPLATLGPTASTPSKDSATSIPSPMAPESPLGADLPSRVRATASRAASLIQKGIGADGVLFLDATVGSVGGVIDSSQTLSQTESETDFSRGSDSSLKDSSSMKQGPSNRHHEEDFTFAKKPLDLTPPDSVILGSAYSADIEARVQSAIEQAKISEKILKSLLRRYPNGQIWHFNAEGDASDEDDELLDDQLDDNLSATDTVGSTGSELEPEQIKSPTTKRASRRDRALKRDGRAIQSIFPGLRSLIFLGMWDPHQERWFGACIAVSYSSMRIFSPQHELSYLAAFCDVVLAEIWRLEAQEIGRSKNVFVSTISHELRSPLHGILGSAECLEEQQHSALSAELIRSITSCGNTLLDVVNDLLEYSRLNHDTRKRRNLQLTGQAGTTASEARAAYVDTESGVNISTLTEDAVTAARLGFDQPSVRSQDLHGAESDPAAVLILNIEDAMSPDWMFSVASGSWKRICINLVTNALKYTPSGYINVTLHKTMLKRKLNKPQTALIELIVG